MTARVLQKANGRTLHVGGRHRPTKTKKTHPALFKALKDFGPIPTAPDSFSYFDASKKAQSDILGNDQLGDCTAAGACHLVEAVTAAAGAPVVFQRTDAIRFYSLSTGYDPLDANTDQGGDEVTVCNVWKSKGLDGQGAHAIVGFVSVDPCNAAELKSACWLFGGLYFGLELDSTWPQTVTGDGFVWDEGTPDPQDGHCIIGGGANDAGILVNSWGFLGTLTYRAIEKFCADSAGGNVFAILTQDILDAAREKAPNGYDWAALQAYFDGLAAPASSDDAKDAKIAAEAHAEFKASGEPAIPLKAALARHGLTREDISDPTHDQKKDGAP